MVYLYDERNYWRLQLPHYQPKSQSWVCGKNIAALQVWLFGSTLNQARSIGAGLACSDRDYQNTLLVTPGWQDGQRGKVAVKTAASVPYGVVFAGVLSQRGANRACATIKGDGLGGPGYILPWQRHLKIDRDS